MRVSDVSLSIIRPASLCLPVYREKMTNSLLIFHDMYYLAISTPLVAPGGGVSSNQRNQSSQKRTQSSLDIAVNRELASCKSSDHEQASEKTSKRAANAKLTSNLDEAGDGSFACQALCFVDLG